MQYARFYFGSGLSFEHIEEDATIKTAAIFENGVHDRINYSILRSAEYMLGKNPFIVLCPFFLKIPDSHYSFPAIFASLGGQLYPKKLLRRFPLTIWKDNTGQALAGNQHIFKKDDLLMVDYQSVLLLETPSYVFRGYSTPVTVGEFHAYQDFGQVTLWYEFTFERVQTERSTIETALKLANSKLDSFDLHANHEDDEWIILDKFWRLHLSWDDNNFMSAYVHPVVNGDIDVQNFQRIR